MEGANMTDKQIESNPFSQDIPEWMATGDLFPAAGEDIAKTPGRGRPDGSPPIDWQEVGRIRRSLKAFPLSEVGFETGVGEAVEVVGVVDVVFELDQGFAFRLHDDTGEKLVAVADLPRLAPEVNPGDLIRVAGKVADCQSPEDVAIFADDFRHWPKPTPVDPDFLRRELLDIMTKAEDLVAPRKEQIAEPEDIAEAVFALGDRITTLSGYLAEAATGLDILSKVQGELAETAKAYNRIFATTCPDDFDFAIDVKSGAYCLLGDCDFPTLGFKKSAPAGILSDEDIPF